MDYVPRPKGSAVARFIPVLASIEATIYFACTQYNDTKLAGATVTTPFEGWQLAVLAAKRAEEVGGAGRDRTDE